VHDVLSEIKNWQPRSTPGARGPTSLKALFEGVWRIERDLHLLNREIHGICYWPLIRTTLLYLLSQDAGIHATMQPRLRRSLFGRVFKEALPVATGLMALPYRTSGPFDTVLVPFPRKVVWDGRVVDIQAERVINDRGFGRVLTLDRRSDAGQMYQSAPDRTVADCSGLRALSLVRAAAILPRFLSAAAAERQLLGAALRREFTLDCPLSAAHIAARIAFFSEGRRVMRRALRASGARTVVVVGHHTSDGVIPAARDLGMLTVELQHGLISPYQSDYHFPGRPVVPYMPDQFLVFGAYWAENVDLSGNMKVVVIGADRLLRRTQMPTRRIPRRVVVASQGTIGARLFGASVMAARAARDWEFVFRPHPQESVERYAARVAALSPAVANLRLSEQREDLHDLLASAEVQVGVYSTSLFEGMALGVRTIVLALPGWENVTRAIEQGDAVVANTPADIAALLPVAPVSRHQEQYFAPPIDSMARALERP
jgi:hypothetical protein